MSNFKYNELQYQIDAVKSVIDVFAGQPYQGLKAFEYKSNILGKLEKLPGTYNPEIVGNVDILKNIQDIQKSSNLVVSTSIKNNTGAVSLDIEMETGTGKTYTYTKTIFELHKVYGWSKFIIVVPSIAIREGIKKSFEDTCETFHNAYGTKANVFIYNSSRLNDIHNYAQSSNLEVMIINCQAFNSSFDQSKNNANTRIIYSERDTFGSQVPIEVIAGCNPILILDEPQKMSGEKTTQALKQFKPLFTLNYSATHKVEHNLIYSLDAIDAYNQKLVKKIEVKGIDIKGLNGQSRYIYVESIKLSQDKAPQVKIHFEKSVGGNIKRVSKLFDQGDDLYAESNNLDQYKTGCRIIEINGAGQYIELSDGSKLSPGDLGVLIEDLDLRRVQIRETILSHFEKEKNLYPKGIKVLSLFFIDKVANYRQYDEDNNAVLGEYGKIFEEEYNNIFTDVHGTAASLSDSSYADYLETYCKDETKAHKGYFSIDKKGKVKDTGKKESEDDISAYDLILKNKERLLSFEEPTRFIFSHSALSEGWDNPNVFQICTLKENNSDIKKRQEIGRGMRICLNKDFTRQDRNVLSGKTFNEINLLTVISSQSYNEYVKDLQTEIKENIKERPVVATAAYFEGKVIKVNGEDHTITAREAGKIMDYLWDNGYADETDGKMTLTYTQAKENDNVAPITDPMLENMQTQIYTLIEGIGQEIPIYTGRAKAKNRNNVNFEKKEFQDMWRQINYKYTYTCRFDSEELIKDAIIRIDANLNVPIHSFTVTTGIQNEEEIDENSEIFKEQSTKSHDVKVQSVYKVPYDLLGEISKNCKITRHTVKEILKGIRQDKFAMFKTNPEAFISLVSAYIIEAKSTTIGSNIIYNKTNDRFECEDIFTDNEVVLPARSVEGKKSVEYKVEIDSDIEEKLAKALDIASEVCVYTKIPKGNYYIPTPVGNYSPDWAIAFNDSSDIKHIYFIAETKGSMSSLSLRPIEDCKIKCAKQVFNDLSGKSIKYDVITSFDELMDKIKS